MNDSAPLSQIEIACHIQLMVYLIRGGNKCLNKYLRLKV